MILVAYGARSPLVIRHGGSYCFTNSLSVLDGQIPLKAIENSPLLMVKLVKLPIVDGECTPIVDGDHPNLPEPQFAPGPQFASG